MLTTLYILPFIIWGSLILLLFILKISFGHGLADIIYYPLPFLGFSTYAVCFYFLNHTYFFSGIAFFYILSSILFILKMTVWRGPENRWHGSLFSPIKNEHDLMDKQILKNLDKLIKNDPNNYDLRLEKVIYLASKNQYKKALKTLKIAKTIAPERPEYFQIVALIKNKQNTANIS